MFLKEIPILLAFRILLIARSKMLTRGNVINKNVLLFLRYSMYSLSYFVWYMKPFIDLIFSDTLLMIVYHFNHFNDML